MPLKSKTLKSTALLMVILLIAFVVDFYRYLQTPMAVEESFLYELNPGTSVSALARSLYKQKLLERPRYLSWWARISGQATRLKAGEYEISAGLTPFALLDMMVNGKVRLYSLTLVEGKTYWQMFDQVHQSPYLKHSLADLTDEEIMARIGHAGEHPEGRFYPDTYHFPKGLVDVEFLQRAYAEMDKRLQSAWEQRDVGLPFDTPYEALVMASIVEKETALASERKQIAGVFINRLRKRMRLQTDPTVIYGLGKDFDGDIRFRDLRADTPYNTYTRRGLPPTPIAMPGQEALDAVMHPDTTPYLYFVARGDESGSHIFSET
ncbi:MAG: endolytic transglycosylase MltG, partial [Gammaproteobacteria bacterium]|nr:endolytic transglycosylase MltG [Gammaproteobacteria bacterium]